MSNDEIRTTAIERDGDPTICGSPGVGDGFGMGITVLIGLGAAVLAVVILL